MLLATPALLDPHFKDTVILICQHNADGCLGLIINRPREIHISDVLDDLGLGREHSDSVENVSQPVYEGGPMDGFRGFLLHDGGFVYDSTMQITTDLHLTASRDALEALSRGHGPEHYLLLLGYAGWDAGQLELELAENSWLLAPASQQVLFHEPPASRWDAAASKLGIDRSHLSSQIGHA